MIQKVALIAGASGLTGSNLTKKLIQSNDFTTIKILSRRQLEINSPKVEQIIVPSFDENVLQNVDLIQRLKCDVAFCALGTTIKNAGSKDAFKRVDYDAVKNLVVALESLQTRAFVLISAMGANSNSLIFYNRVKGDTESLVEASSIPYRIIFRPSFLIGKRQEKRFGEFQAIKAISSLKPFIPRKIYRNAATEVDTLALRMMKTGLEALSSTENRSLKIFTASEIL
jgi:uncharacterized protein YbjT (DUF2867 family)